MTNDEQPAGKKPPEIKPPEAKPPETKAAEPKLDEPPLVVTKSEETIEMEKRNNEKAAKKGMMLAVAMGMELIALELVGIFGGHYLGGGLGNSALGAVAGSVLGFVVWTWRLIVTKRYVP